MRLLFIFWFTYSYTIFAQTIRYSGQVINTSLSYTNIDSLIIDNCRFENITESALQFTNIHYVRIKNSVFNNIGNGAIGGSGCNTILIENNEFDSIYNYAILSTNTTLRNVSLRISSNFISNIFNTTAETGTAIRAFNTDSVIITNNYISNCQWSGIAAGRNSSIQAQQRINYLFIGSNAISFTASDAISAQENILKSEVRNNVISNVAVDGIGGRPNFGDHGMYWQAPDAIIEGNEIFNVFDGQNCALGCKGLGISLRTSAKVLRNKIYNCESNGIGYFNDHPTGTEPLLIANNVVYDNQYSGIYINGTSSNTKPNTLLIYNNTIMNGLMPGLWHHSCPVGINGMPGTQNVNGNILIYENVSDTTQTFWYNNTNTSIESFLYNVQKTGDIGFADYIHRNFDLTNAASIAIDKIPFQSNYVTHDFYNNQRVNNGDIGAIELQNVTALNSEIQADFSLYPNPTGDFTKIIFSNKKPLSSILMYDYSGKII